jgi:uncharacterized protein (DUF736 family)
MSNYEQKPGTGVLFPNESDNPKAPNSKGSLTMPDGTRWDLAGWRQESKNGKKYLSLKVEEPRQKDKPKAEKPAAPDFEDSIPFAWAFAIPLAGLLAAAMYVGPAVI